MSVRQRRPDERSRSVTCRNVGHTQQQFDWDCGLSCVLMALDAAEELDEYIPQNVQAVLAVRPE